MESIPMRVVELIDRMRFLEAHECELGFAESDPTQRELHFKNAELYAARTILLKQQIEQHSIISNPTISQQDNYRFI